MSSVPLALNSARGDVHVSHKGSRPLTRESTPGPCQSESSLRAPFPTAKSRSDRASRTEIGSPGIQPHKGPRAMDKPGRFTDTEGSETPSNSRCSETTVEARSGRCPPMAVPETLCWSGPPPRLESRSASGASPPLPRDLVTVESSPNGAPAPRGRPRPGRPVCPRPRSNPAVF